MAAPEQRPLELILARNLLSNISTPAMLVNGSGDALFFNEAAGVLLGRRFEETGVMPAAEWTEQFGPLADDGTPIPFDRQPLTVALRANRAAYARHQLRQSSGDLRPIEASGVPIVGASGFQGAMIFFWRRPEDER
jgi:PAS domain-containing protein